MDKIEVIKHGDKFTLKINGVDVSNQVCDAKMVIDISAETPNINKVQLTFISHDLRLIGFDGG